MKELMCLFLTGLLSSVDGEAQGVYITAVWDGAYHGHFTLSPSQALHGWKAHLLFSKPVDTLELWTADIVSHSDDKKEWVITNKAWDGDINAGAQQIVEFNGRAPGNLAPTATIYIEGIDQPPSGFLQSTHTESSHGTGGQTVAQYTGTAETTTLFTTNAYMPTSTSSTTSVTTQETVTTHLSTSLSSTPPSASTQAIGVCVDSTVFNCNPAVCSFECLKQFCPSTCNSCGFTVLPTATTKWLYITGK